MKTKIPQLSLLSLSLLSNLYGAGPVVIENAQVVSGGVSFDGLQSNAATITQHTNKAIVDYDRFDVMRGGAVNFVQPSERAAILNRIKGGDPSFLNGSITGNGQIYFVNPAGVTFGPNSIIRADTFMAVAGQIANEDFMAGQLQFDLQGTVSNYGLIETLNDVALLGDRVINAGDIVSKSGVSILSAGDEVLLRENGSTLAVQLTSAGAVPKEGVAIENSGTVAGDEVMFSAGDAYSLALSNSGTVRAAKSAKLHADDGAIEVSGLVSAKSDEAAGRIEIGGTDRGAPSAPIASEVLIAETALIDASAQVEGAGGEIVIYSAGDTTMLGAIDVQSKGAADAGHVEVSGSHVDFGTNPWEISIGRGGSLLVDPIDMTIDQTAADGYATTLDGGADVEITTVVSPDLGTEAGDITLNGDIQHFNRVDAGNLTLEAAGSIFINNIIDNGSGNITLDAGDSITVSQQIITGAPSSGALIQLKAPDGTVTFNGVGNLELYGDANAQIVAQNLVNNVGSGAILQSGLGHWQIVLQSWNTAASPNEQLYGGLVSVDKAQFGSTGDATAITKNEYHFVQTRAIGIQVSNDSKTYGDAISDPTYQQYVVDPDTFVDATLNAGAFTQDTIANTIVDDSNVVTYTTAGSALTADASAYDDLTVAGLASTNGYTYDVTPGTFTVLKRDLQVTANDRNRIYGDELVLGTSEFTYIDTHDGDTTLPNGEVLVAVTLGSDNDVATDVLYDVEVYSDEVTVDVLSANGDFNPDNYELTPVSGSLEVTKRDITVTAQSQEKFYGDVESFGGTLDSLDNSKFEVFDVGTTSAVLPNGESIISTTMKYTDPGSGSPLVDLGQSSVQGAGTRPGVIEIDGVIGNVADVGSKAFDVDNYNINYENGDYTIKKRPITVTALGQNKEYGENVVLLNDDIGGFQVIDDRTLSGPTMGLVLPNNEKINTAVIASLGGNDASTNQDAETYAADLDISAIDTTSGGFNLNNYEIAYVKGDFTIDPRQVTLTALAQSKIYGNTLVLNDTAFKVADQGVDGDTALPNGEMIDTVTYVSTDVANLTLADVDLYVNEIEINGQAGSATAPASYDPDNYAFTYVNGNLNVTKRAITVTAQTQEKFYGDVESFGGSVDSLDNSKFLVTDLSEPQLPNGESIVSTTMEFRAGPDLGVSTTADAGTTPGVIKITGFIGNTADVDSKAFNEDNYQITPLNGDYTIKKRPITVTALGQNKQYGEDVVLLNDDIGGFQVIDDRTLSGPTMGLVLPNDEKINTVVIASVGGYDSSTNQAAGIYDDNLVISAVDTASDTFNADNYEIDFVEGDFRIDPRQVTLIAEQQSKLYGDTLVLDGTAFTVADQGVVGDMTLPNGEVIDTVTYVSTDVANLTLADAGLYGDEIEINGQVGSATAPEVYDADNYAFTYVKGDLLVNSRSITVTALDQQKTYGESVVLTNSAFFSLEDPKLGASLPNNDMINSVNLLSAGGNGDTTSAAGFYLDDLSIDSLNTSGGFKPSNYIVKAETGDFQVDLRSITISLLDQEKPYGEPYDFDSEAFTLYDPLSDSPNLPNGEQVVGVTFQTPAMNPITAAPGVYESLLQGQGTIGDSGFDASNYSITFNPADLNIYYINDIEAPIVPGEAYLDQQQYVYSGSPFKSLFSPTPPISANGFSSIVERPEWTSMTPEQQAWVFAQVAHIPGATQLSEELVEYLIAGAKGQ